VSDFNVGPGISQSMADHGDEPRSNENFIVNEPEGSKISECYGRDNIYYWMEADNAIRVVPFRT
jgi:hypothetical protein